MNVENKNGIQIRWLREIVKEKPLKAIGVRPDDLMQPL